MEQILERFSGKTGLVFTDINQKEYIAIDKDCIYPTASVIKIYVLGALLKACELGQRKLDEEVAVHNEEDVDGSGILKIMSAGIKVKVIDLAMLMIALSDNVATNLLIDYLDGPAPINQFIRSCGLEKTTLNRKVSSKDEDTLLGISTPFETAMYLGNIVRGTLLTEEYTTIFLDIMKEQQLNDSFVRGLEDIEMAHKTGCFEGAKVDVGYLFTETNTYIFSAFTDQCKDWNYYCDNEGDVHLGYLGKYCYETYMA